VLVRESSEFSRYPSPQVIMGMMGMGKSPDEYVTHSARYRTWLSGLFTESVRLVAEGLGIELDTVEVEEDTRVTDDELTIAAGTIAAGTVAAQRWTWAGMRNGHDVIRLEAIYKATPQVAPEWTSPAWVTRIEGSPRIVLEADRWLSNGLLATAMHAVHAVPVVCDAEAGVKTFLDLPLIIGRHTVA
jgi:2,4-diaminopentanoate dehydrogenase